MAVQLQSISYLGEAPVKVIILVLFILLLEILFHLIKSKPEIKGLATFGHCYYYSAVADDITFFLQVNISIKHMTDT